MAQAIFSRDLAANYPGDASGIIGEVKGPNLLGEYLRAISATYDPVTNQTRVTFEIVN